jgi:hypothetical protein
MPSPFIRFDTRSLLKVYPFIYDHERLPAHLRMDGPDVLSYHSQEKKLYPGEEQDQNDHRADRRQLRRPKEELKEHKNDTRKKTQA